MNAPENTVKIAIFGIIAIQNKKDKRMADSEHVKILEQGVEIWNKWREESLIVSPDLTKTNFSKKKSILKGANMRNANLNEADFSGVDFSEANFSEAQLIGADLSRAKFKKADLGRANFSGANLSNSNLHRANLSGADLSRANLSGADLYATSRDYWKINGVKCDYVYWSRDRKTRTPESRNFSLGEFEELYKWKSLDDFNNLIMRSIEFPEEYKQAGSSILNYFSEILRKKYPDTNATVQIKQDNLKIAMIIDPVDGDREIIEKALNDYGLVVTGNMKPEEFTDDKLLIMDLQNQLGLTKLQIENQKRMLDFQSEEARKKDIQINRFLDIIEAGIQRPVKLKVSQKQGDVINIDAKKDVIFAKDQAKASSIKESQAGIFGDNAEVSGSITSGEG